MPRSLLKRPSSPRCTPTWITCASSNQSNTQITIPCLFGPGEEPGRPCFNPLAWYCSRWKNLYDFGNHSWRANRMVKKRKQWLQRIWLAWTPETLWFHRLETHLSSECASNGAERSKNHIFTSYTRTHNTLTRGKRDGSCYTTYTLVVYILSLLTYTSATYTLPTHYLNTTHLYYLRSTYTWPTNCLHITIVPKPYMLYPKLFVHEFGKPSGTAVFITLIEVEQSRST